jgi:hypothetical protein
LGGVTPIPPNFLAMETAITILNYLTNRLKIPVRKFTTNDPVTQGLYPIALAHFRAFAKSTFFPGQSHFASWASWVRGPPARMSSRFTAATKRHSVPLSEAAPVPALTAVSPLHFISKRLCAGGMRTGGPRTQATHPEASLGSSEFLSLGLCASTSPLPSLLRKSPVGSYQKTYPNFRQFKLLFELA